MEKYEEGGEDEIHEVYGDEEEAEEYMEPDPNSKELEEMKKRLKEIEQEAGALREMQAKVEKEMGLPQGKSSRIKIERPKNFYKDPDDGRQRFLLELEFVQCLANPTYIHYLAQNRYFEDEAFIGYLKYLQYWQRPEYIKFIMYPHCLFFLELLQNANFRNAMAHPANKELAHRQQFYLWKNYRNNRLKHILPRPLPEPVNPPPASAPPPPPVLPAAPLPTATIPIQTAAASTPSPMPYGIPPGSSISKSDSRSAGIDRRKRKKEV